MEIRKINLLLPVFLLSFVLTGLVTVAEPAPKSAIRQACEDDETSVMGLYRKNGYGSHVYDPGTVETPYNVCFDEPFGAKDGSFEYKFVEDSCGDYEPILDIYDYDDANGTLGSHVAERSEYDNGGKFCLRHTGLLNVLYPDFVSVDDSYSCPRDYCFLLGTLAKEKNSHIGNGSWSHGEYEVWVVTKKNVPDVRLDINLTSPDYDWLSCTPGRQCDVASVSLDPDPKENLTNKHGVSCNYDYCYKYPKYTDVGLTASTHGSDDCWHFDSWDVVGDGEKNDNPVSVELRDSTTEIIANFALDNVDLEVTSTEGGEVLEPGEGLFTYKCSETVSLEAEPDKGYRFVEWTNDTQHINDITSSNTEITMYGDYNVTAVFKEVKEGPCAKRCPCIEGGFTTTWYQDKDKDMYWKDSKEHTFEGNITVPEAYPFCNSSHLIDGESPDYESRENPNNNVEICNNSKDDDLDGEVDAEDMNCSCGDSIEGEKTRWCYDGDGDGYFNGTTKLSCTDPGGNWKKCSELESEGGHTCDANGKNCIKDCDDKDFERNPGAMEKPCTSKDENCVSGDNWLGSDYCS